MRYDYEPEGEYKKKVIEGLARLRGDLAGGQLVYIDARLAVERFVQQDFALNDQQSSLYVEQLEWDGILPAPSLFDEDEDAALRMHRRALFNHWMPLYRELNDDSDVFKIWVAELLEVAVPRGGGHGAHCRDDRVLGALGTAAFVPCGVAVDCPVNTIASQVLQKTPFLPMYPEEYGAFDADRAREDALSLLGAVATRRFIDPHETREAARDVREMYHYLTA